MKTQGHVIMFFRTYMTNTETWDWYTHQENIICDHNVIKYTCWNSQVIKKTTTTIITSIGKVAQTYHARRFEDWNNL